MNSTLPPYVYERLQPDQFRLGVITQVHRTLVFTLEHCDFATAPDYHALSYVWGQIDTSFHRSIICVSPSGSKGSLSVSPNLYAVLEAICSKKRGRIWIDALCIDQQNNALEKNHQVRLMHKIYGQAKQVLVWLGESTAGSDLAVELCRWLGTPMANRDESFKSFPTIRQRLNSNEPVPFHASQLWRLAEIVDANNEVHLTAENFARQGLPDFADPVWQFFSELFAKPWLSRVWTFQEVMLAKDVLVRCGDSVVPWDLFYNVGMRLSRTQLLFHPGVLRAAVAAQHQDRHFTKLRSFMYPRGNGEYFWLYVSEARNKGVSNPVDRIYGLLSLANEQVRNEIPVDYTRPAQRQYWALYKTAAKVIMKHWGVHLVLQGVDILQRHPHLPSWCPNYNARAKEDRALPSGVAGFFNPTTVKIFEPCIVDDIIRIGGFSIDAVDELLDDFDWQWSHNPHLNTGPSGYAAKIVNWMNRVEKMIGQRIADPGRLETVFWQCLLAYVPPRKDGTRITVDEFPVYPEKGLKVLRRRFEELSSGLEGDGPALTLEDRDLMQPVMGYMRRIWRGMVFFVSKSGHFGLASRGFDINDKVCIFVGATHFYLLRQLEHDDLHEFRSIAYVHGLMQGEALSSVTEGTHETYNIC